MGIVMGSICSKDKPQNKHKTKFETIRQENKIQSISDKKSSYPNKDSHSERYFCEINKSVKNTIDTLGNNLDSDLRNSFNIEKVIKTNNFISKINEKSVSSDTYLICTPTKDYQFINPTTKLNKISVSNDFIREQIFESDETLIDKKFNLRYEDTESEIIQNDFCENYININYKTINEKLFEFNH